MTQKLRNCFVFTGERSGDLQTAPIIARLQQTNPQMTVTGVGGEALLAQGLSPVLPLADFQVMGLTDVLAALPRLVRGFRTLVRHILDSQPDLVLLVDSPSLTLRLAKKLRKKGYTGKIVQYICPKVWAWGAHRIESMARDLDLLLTIFPFEPALFAKTSLPATYIGNPLVRDIQSHTYSANWRAHCGLPEGAPLLALFPGSRPGEIERNLPRMLAATRDYQSDAQLAISLSASEHADTIRRLADRPVHLVPPEYRYELMKEAQMAVAKAGTNNLELALHETPTVVIYALTRLNRFFAQYILRVQIRLFSIVNILLGKEAFPERIASGCTPQQIREALQAIDPDQVRADCRTLKQAVTQQDPAQAAAQAIENIL